MSEDTNKPGAASTASDGRKVYIAQISFSIPDSGPVHLLARDPEHAKELLPKMLAHVKDLVVHDIVEESKIENKVQLQGGTPDETPVAPAVLN